MVAGIGISTLTQRFQQWAISLHTDLGEVIHTYRFGPAFTLQRRLSPLLRGGLSFRSDARKRANYQVYTQAETNLGGEEASWNGGGEFSWGFHPRFQIRTGTNFYYTLRETQSLLGPPVPGYYLRQFNTFRLDNQLEINWFLANAFRVFAGIDWSLTQYQGEHAVQVLPSGQLVAYEYEYKHLQHKINRQLQLGGQWYFAPLSQLRFQYAYLPDRVTPYTSDILGIGYTLKSGGRTELSLAFICTL